LTNKQGSYTTKLPTQFRTRKSKKKVLKKEGDKHNLSIEKCPVCNKQKMEKYDLIYKENGSSVTIRKCKKCGFTNASSVVWMNMNESKPSISFFDPKRVLE